MKKLLLSLMVICMMAGMASATLWNGSGGTEGSPQNWNVGANWDGGSPPATNDVADFLYDRAPIEITDAAVANYLYFTKGEMYIRNGGTLDTTASWNMIGIKVANTVVNIEAGGAADFGGHLWVSTKSGQLTTINLAGTLSVGNAFELGGNDFGSGGKATLNVLEGGNLNLGQFINGSIQDGSFLDIRKDGVVTINGEATNVVQNLIAEGKILGNRTTNNVEIGYSIVGVVTNTTITAIDSIPGVEGLTVDEATILLADYGYVVGTVSTGTVAGALTDHVIAQTPAAGSAPIASGSSIDLVIQNTSIPNLVGMSVPEATAILEGMGLSTGTVSRVYILGATPDEVLEQSPAAGEQAEQGDTVDLVATEAYEEGGGIVWNPESGSNWTNDANWTGGVAPMRETQNLKATFNLSGATEAVLSTNAAVRQLAMGDGGAGALRIVSGGSLITGFGDWTAIGYDNTATLTVETNGFFQTRSYVLLGLYGTGFEPSLNIDGGEADIAGTIEMGSNGGGSHGIVNVDGGGFLKAAAFNFKNTNSFVNVSLGTIELSGDKTGSVSTQIADGQIVIGPGSTYSLDYDVTTAGNTTLKVYAAGYDGWASLFLPTVIGSETDDYDNDQRNNFYEYTFAGNPTNALDLGVDPVLTNNAGTLEYTYVKRHDNPNLVYSVKTTTDLVNMPWVNAGYIVMGTNVTGEAYDLVSNSIPTTADQTFVQLEVQ